MTTPSGRVPHPTFTNAHAQMCAVITTLTNVWGDHAQALVRRTYRELGHRTGRQMIDDGIVPAGADLETYGRVSEQIMDTCGLEGWSRITTEPAPRAEHRTVVPGCAAYVPLFKFLGAPENICSLPFEWDNGCLDVINDELEIWPRRCVYQGAHECHYVISHREGASRGADIDLPPSTAGLTVKDAPTWTNPTAGFLALIGAAATTFGHQARRVLHPALHALGARAGIDDLGGATTAAAAGQLLAERYAAAGFPVAETTSRATGTIDVQFGHNPYGPVLERFGARDVASELFTAYDEGWIGAAGGARLRIRMTSDSWRRGGTHALQIVDEFAPTVEDPTTTGARHPHD